MSSVAVFKIPSNVNDLTERPAKCFKGSALARYNESRPHANFSFFFFNRITHLTFPRGSRAPHPGQSPPCDHLPECSGDAPRRLQSGFQCTFFKKTGATVQLNLS